MIKANFSSGLEVLLDQKNMSIDERRRIVATNAALELISVAVRKENSTHKLEEEFKNLSSYVDAICESLAK